MEVMNYLAISHCGTDEQPAKASVKFGAAQDSLQNNNFCFFIMKFTTWYS